MLGSIKFLTIILVLAFFAGEALAQRGNFTLYVLPPGDESWILGTPHLKVGSEEPEKFQIDETCGWFRKIFVGSVPEEDAWIWLGARKDAQVGVLGMREDPVDWPGGQNPTPINLKKQFDTYVGQDTPGELYFFADAGRWQATPPAPSEIEEKRCSYKFAAIIYDTDAAVNTSFHASQTPAAVGISKNIPLNELVYDSASERMKMQFNTAKTTNLDGWTKANFDDSFRAHETKNVVRCYDMPYKRNKSGQWEFNSNKLCSDGSMDLEGICRIGGRDNSYLGGYFPIEIQTRGDADYTKCPQCDKPQPTSGFRPLSTTRISEYCYDRGFNGTGTTLADCGAPFTEGQFNNYTNPNIWAAADQSLPSSVPRNRNSLLCFESAPAEFEYEPGQEFFFSGDDDIWIFINNKMVIDLGGTHVAAPAYVNLDTLGLTPGEKYPINIFFCDRRVTQSNVRISTNMYFAPKSGLSLKAETVQKLDDVCLEISGGGSCAVVSGDAKAGIRCGEELSGLLNYYITRYDGSGRQELTANTEGCSQEGNVLKCFESITIDFSNGKVQVLPSAKGIVGTWVAYAEVKTVEVSPLRLGTTSGRTSVQVVWGNVQNAANGQTITTIGYKDKAGQVSKINGKVGKEAVASKLIPVGFAQGAWTSDSEGPNATFQLDVGESAGKVLRIQGSSLKDQNVDGSYLLAYRDSAGTEEVNLSDTISIPASGVLVLYFTGSYEAAGPAVYNINSGTVGEPFALKVHQPVFAFVNDRNDSIPKAQRIGSDPSKGTNATERWVYVGSTLNRKIAAFDPVDGGICKTCLFKSADIATDPYISVRNGASAKNKEAILFTEKTWGDSDSAGTGRLSLYSTIRIQFDQDSSAYFTVGGPSPDPSTIARWDSLQFREPPVPYPISAEIFDRNGDGIGDSLRIVYNKEFPKDTLPNMVQVVWAPKDTMYFGLGRKDAGGKYTDVGITTAANNEYWKNYLKKGVCPATVKNCSDTLVITVPYGTRESPQPQLSKEIKTAVHDVGETVISWSTYTNDEGVAGQTSSFATGITDKMPPVIVSAEFKGDERECGTDAANYCIDYVYIELSEPVVKAEGIANEAFAYRLLSKGENATFEVYKENKSLPTEILWRPPSGPRNFPEQDSSVRLTYRRYKTEFDGSDTPLPSDSVRLLDNRGAKPAEHALKDLAGNFPHPKEWGRRIEGRGPFNVNKNLIAAIDPLTADSVLKETIRKRFGNAIADKFTEKNPIQLMPVPENWKGDSLVRELRDNYPSTVGTVFWPGARATVLDLDAKYGAKVPRDKIFFVANSFYHTNLGNYTAKSGELRIACDDDVFKIEVNGVKAKDCTESENGIYLAWDLRDNKGRWVGTGAYVQVYNFYWEVKDVEPSSKGVNVNGVLNRYPSEGNKVEMFGVRRGAKKDKSNN
jgi:fibro-slime domain-containing protein